MWTQHAVDPRCVLGADSTNCSPLCGGKKPSRFVTFIWKNTFNLQPARTGRAMSLLWKAGKGTGRRWSTCSPSIHQSLLVQQHFKTNQSKTINAKAGYKLTHTLRAPSSPPGNAGEEKKVPCLRTCRTVGQEGTTWPRTCVVTGCPPDWGRFLWFPADSCDWHNQKNLLLPLPVSWPLVPLVQVYCV